jgi:D-amino-acid dehydrogenase
MLGWGLAFLRESTPDRHRTNTTKNLRLAQYSLETMAELRAATAIQYEQASSGTLLVFRHQRDLDAAARDAEFLAERGVAFDVLDRPGVVGCEPALEAVGAGFAGGIFYAGDERGDAHRFCAEMTRVGQDAGVEFRFGVSVDAVLKEGSRVSAIRTGRETDHADVFVMAGGSYSEVLLRPLGLRIPVRPAKGYSITVRAASERVPSVPVVDHDLHAGIVPVGDDRIRAVGTAEFAGFDLSLDPVRVENLKKLLLEIYPQYATELAAGNFEPWAGLRPMTVDGVPLVGATSLQNLYLNTGHGHLGWTLAAGSGKLLADLIAGTEPGIPANDFSPGRFRRLAVIH